MENVTNVVNQLVTVTHMNVAGIHHSNVLSAIGDHVTNRADAYRRVE